MMSPRELDFDNFDTNGYLINWALSTPEFPDSDLASAGDSSCARVPKKFLIGFDMLVCTFGADTITNVIDLQLVVYDRTNDRVLACIPGLTGPAPNPRRKNAADDAGVYVHASVQWDLRGLPNLGKQDYDVYIVVTGASISTTTDEDMELLHIRGVRQHSSEAT